MDHATHDIAQGLNLSECLRLDPTALSCAHFEQHSVAQALSLDANQIGMTGFSGGAERLAIVAGRGLTKMPEGLVQTVKEEGGLGLSITAVESLAVGAGLKILTAKAAPIAGLATLALGTSFLAQTAPKFWDACARGLHANTWTEMDNASSKFGQATGALAVDTLIGCIGFKVGSSGAGLTRWGNHEGLVPKLASAAAEAPASPANIARSLHDVDTSAVESTVEAAKVTDSVPIAKRVVSPEHTISMRNLLELDPARFEKTLDAYYPKLENAFPDASEIESRQTYRDYLKDKDFPWDMLVLHDKGGNVLGGIHSQVVDVGGTELQKAVWAEHIWLAPEARTFSNFQTLLKTAKENFQATGSDIVFMEFNDRAKMSWEEQVADASAGLTPEARERIWGRVGLYVLGDESRHLAPYAQPAMGDGGAVNYLSVGVGPLKSSSLDGQSMPIADYLKLLRAAHSTIPDLNLDTDPTVVAYTSALGKLTDSGQDRLSYARLRDTQVSRTIMERFIGGGSNP